ncbi:MAG: Gfo/Idh/MocA family protein, partial [Burkholderiales bacterium]
MYRELEQAGRDVRLAAVVDRDAAVASAAAAEFGISGFTSVEDCLAAPGGVDAASVCVPTVGHALAAAPLLAGGVDVLVEKPLAASLADTDAILTLARENGRIVQAGHLERFNPAVTAARGQLNRPMF